MRRLTVTLSVAALLAGSAIAADLGGIWVGQLPPGRGGQPQDIAFKFTQTGTAIGGKLYGDYKSASIVEGQVTGDQIAFIVIAPEQSGNLLNETRFKFTGTIKDGEIELVRERQLPPNAGNGQGAANRNGPQTFRLKRLL